MAPSPDIVIIGSGIGGATLAAGLAGSGAKILILERGERLVARPENRNTRAIYQRGVFRPDETWYDGQGRGFNPGNYYNVGGNSKFFGAVLTRFRASDFTEVEHPDGVSPAWPFPYGELEPWYGAAEKLYGVRGQLGEDTTEPEHTNPYEFAPVADEPAIAEVRQRLVRAGLTPYSLPLGINIERWLAAGRTPWDGFPNVNDGKMDAETTALAAALKDPEITLETGAKVLRLITEPDGKRISGIEYEKEGARTILAPGMVVLCAGAVQSAVLLLASANAKNPDGLANGSGQVGRNFMNHNSSAMIAIDPRFRNTSIYQKTFGCNDFYLSDGAGAPPLGNVQLLGRIDEKVLKSAMRAVPERALKFLTDHSIDFYLMSEDLPSPDSRIRLDGAKIVLEWQRTNMKGHRQLVEKFRAILRGAGFPLVLTKPFDNRTPSHQCGTVRMGLDPATAPLDPFCRTYDHENLFVVDAGFLPTSAALNPALTIAAQALRVAHHIGKKVLAK